MCTVQLQLPSVEYLEDRLMQNITPSKAGELLLGFWHPSWALVKMLPIMAFLLI